MRLLWFILFTNPSARAGYDTRSIFKWSLTGFNSEFSFSETCCLTKAEEPSLSYYLPIAGGRIIGFIPFPSVLVLREMQSVSSSIWTRVTVSISYDDNHYTTGSCNLLSSLPGPLWPGVLALDRVLSMGHIELNYVLMLNWIVWNRTVLIFKRTALTFKYMQTKTILIQNWIVQNLIQC